MCHFFVEDAAYIESFADKKYWEIPVSIVFLFINSAMTDVYKQKHDAY